MFPLADEVSDSGNIPIISQNYKCTGNIISVIKHFD